MLNGVFEQKTVENVIKTHARWSLAVIEYEKNCGYVFKSKLLSF